MKRIIICYALLVAGILAFAQEDEGGAEDPGAQSATAGFTLSGSVEGGATLSVQNESSVFAGLSSYAETSAAGVMDGKLSFSRNYATLGLLDFTFTDSALIDSDDGSTIETPSFKVNELYADLNFGDVFFLRLGKQRLSWGAGYVYNPSDPVNPPKDPTASRAVREGVSALKAELMSEAATLMAFAVLHDEIDETGFGAKLSTSALPNSDIAVSGYWSPSQSWTTALNASVAPFYDLPGWDTIQIWFEGGIYDEARYAAYAEGALPGSATTAEAAGMQYAALAGASATIPGLRTVVLTEYYHLSEGLSKDEEAAVYRALDDPALKAASVSWYEELARRPARLGRDYLFASVTQPSITDSGDPILDKIGLSATCLVNLADGSFYASGDVTLGFIDEASIELGVDWYSGDSESEFGNGPTSLSFGLSAKVYY